VAPLWALEKQANLQAIREALRVRQIWQGKAYPDGRPVGP
jgi:radical SAM superfamily enzyme